MITLWTSCLFFTSTVFLSSLVLLAAPGLWGQSDTSVLGELEELLLLAKTPGSDAGDLGQKFATWAESQPNSIRLQLKLSRRLSEEGTPDAKKKDSEDDSAKPAETTSETSEEPEGQDDDAADDDAASYPSEEEMANSAVKLKLKPLNFTQEPTQPDKAETHVRHQHHGPATARGWQKFYAEEETRTTEIKYPACTSSVVWGDNYQTLHNLLVKHRSIKAVHPRLPHIVLMAEDMPAAVFDIVAAEGMIVKKINHVQYTAQSREHGFEKIMTKTKALELEECGWVVQMDVDMIALAPILDAVAECETGGFHVCGVPQTPSCSGRDCCLPRANGNILHVLVVNTGFMVYRPTSFMRDKLREMLELTQAPREQTLWGQTICANDDIRFHPLQSKYNTWTNFELHPVHVLHYGIGPAYLGNDIVPFNNSGFYEYTYGFKYYRQLSLAVDPCGRWGDKHQCENVHPLLLEASGFGFGMPPEIELFPAWSTVPPELLDPHAAKPKGVKAGKAEQTLYRDVGRNGVFFRRNGPVLMDFRQQDLAISKPDELVDFYPRCEWRENTRCVERKYSSLEINDQKDQDITQIVDSNAALHCAIRDMPISIAYVLKDCGIFCEYALHLEDFCDVHFNPVACLGLIMWFAIDLRSYNLLWISLWLSCIPKIYRDVLRVGFCVVIGGFLILGYMCYRALLSLFDFCLRRFPVIKAIAYGEPDAVIADHASEEERSGSTSRTKTPQPDHFMYLRSMAHKICTFFGRKSPDFIAAPQPRHVKNKGSKNF